MKKFLLLSFLLPFLPFLVIAVFYLFTVPVGQTPDEPAHLRYIIHIVNYLSFPDYQGSGVAHHPPFYYLILSPFYAVFKNIYLLRFISLIFSFLNLIVIKNIIGLILPLKNKYHNLAWGTAIFCSLVPMYNFMSMAVNNDSLACLFASLLIYFTILSVNRSLSKKEFFSWAILVFAAIFTKIVLWPMIFISAAVIFVIHKEKRFALFLLFSISLAVLSLWFYRNIRLYGGWDILGWQKLREVEAMLVGNKLIIEKPREWLTILFHSFWGIFGWFSIYLPLVIYSILRKVSVIFLLPFIVFLYDFFKKADKKGKQSLILFFLFFVVSFLALIRDNLNFFHPSGRYLFPVISIIGLYYSAGIDQISRLISSIFFKSNQIYVYYLLLFTPLLALNIISAVLIKGFFAK